MRDIDALHAYLAARQDVPFEWTLHDCCVGFVAGAVAAQTGVDHLEGIDGFRSQLGAAKALRRRGGFFEAVSSRLTEVPPAFAMRGDVALVSSMAGIGALMIVEGDMLVGVGEGGLVRLPRFRNDGTCTMIAAWSAET